MIEYEGLLIYTIPEVYEPAEDTYLLAKNLDIQRKDEVLEIGTGTGLIAVYTAQRTKNVVATDISEYAIKCALKNTISNKTFNLELRQGDLFEPVKGEKFNLILFNTLDLLHKKKKKN
jgi:release factor glutamine methyltransferase